MSPDDKLRELAEPLSAALGLVPSYGGEVTDILTPEQIVRMRTAIACYPRASGFGDDFDLLGESHEALRIQRACALVERDALACELARARAWLQTALSQAEDSKQQLLALMAKQAIAHVDAEALRAELAALRAKVGQLPPELFDREFDGGCELCDTPVRHDPDCLYHDWLAAQPTGDA